MKKLNHNCCFQCWTSLRVSDHKSNSIGSHSKNVFAVLLPRCPVQILPRRAKNNPRPDYPRPGSANKPGSIVSSLRILDLGTFWMPDWCSCLKIPYFISHSLFFSSKQRYLETNVCSFKSYSIYEKQTIAALAGDQDLFWKKCRFPQN